MYGSQKNDFNNTPGKLGRKKTISDRHVGLRLNETEKSISTQSISDWNNESKNTDSSKTLYQKTLHEAMFGKSKDKVLSHNRSPNFGQDFESWQKKEISRLNWVPNRPVISPPICLYSLDAPNSLNDFYTNQLDWISDKTLIVALGPDVYMWSVGSKDVVTMLIGDIVSENSGEEYISSVKSFGSYNYLSLGNFKGETIIQNILTKQVIRVVKGFDGPIYSQEPASRNSELIYVGTRIGNVRCLDLRLPDPFVVLMEDHEMSVCSLKMNADENVLASGGNDDAVNLWDVRKSSKLVTFYHNAAVKSLSWCPSKPELLMTGGGQADRCVRVWNTRTNKHVENRLVSKINTEGQIGGVHWLNPETNRDSSIYAVCTSGLMGTDYKMQVIEFVGDQSKLTIKHDMNIHSQKVNSTAISPSKKLLATVSADEVLKIWDLSEVVTTVKSPTKSLKTTNYVPMLSKHVIR